MFTRILIDALAIHADRVLVSDRNRELTGSNIFDQTNSIAANLLLSGIKPGDRVGISMRDQVNALLVFFAAFRIGAVPAFVDFRMKPDIKAHLVDNFNFALLLGDGKSEDFHPRAKPFDPSWLATKVDDDIYRSQPENASGYLAISSGTTGIPKAYVLSEATMISRLFMVTSYEPNDHSKLLISMPFAYTGTHNHLFSGILGGIPLHIMPIVYSTKQLIDILHSEQISGTLIPPAIVHNLLREEHGSTPAFPKLKTLKSGGSPLDPDRIAEACTRLSPNFVMSFGASAAGVIANLHGANIVKHPNSSGAINSGVRIETIDLESHEPLPIGQEGILRISSTSVATDIISVEETSEEVGDGWCITGDVGYINAEGFVFITGRVSDVIVRSGISIAPATIETALKRHSGIDDAVVIGIDDERMGADVAAVVVAPNLSLADIKQHIMQVIDQDKRPRHVRLVKELPYNSNGKLDRNTLKELFNADK